MRVLHMIFSFNVGGAEAMLSDILNHQCKEEHIKLIIVNADINKALLDTVSKQVEILCLKRKPGSKNPIPFLLLNKEIIAYNPDVIHCHNHNLIGAIWLRSYRKKAMLTIHDTGSPITHFKKYRKCIAISQAVKKDVFHRSGLDIEVIYNGIECLSIKYKESIYFDIAKDKPLKIVQVSRLNHEKKGQHLVLQALKVLVEQGISSLQIDFIGTGNSREYLQQLALEMGVEEHVRFLGMKNRDYIYQHLRDYDLLIQPSLYEGFGLTVAEAMAAKVPVLVSSIEGPMEIIANGLYGDCFEVGSVRDLAAKLSVFCSLSTTSGWQHKVQTAFDFCYANFDISNTAKAYLNSYKC